MVKRAQGKGKVFLVCVIAFYTEDLMRRVILAGLALVALVGAAKREVAVVVRGIKTPGVQIPFASLKAETELAAPGKPAWVFFEGAAFYQGAGAGLEKIDAKTGKSVAVLPKVAKPCAGMASGFGSLWVASCADGQLVRFDSKTLKETARITTGIGSAPRAIAAGTDSIWLLTDDKTTLSRIDPDQNAVVGELRVPAGCRGLIFAETAIWMACPGENKVYRVDPATNVVVNQVEVSSGPVALAVGEGSIWVLCKKNGKVDRIDPKTNKVVKSIELGVPGVEGEIAVGEGSVWVTMAGFPITRIRPASEKEAVAQQFVGRGGGAITTSTGAVWLANVAEGTVWKIDPKRVVATLAE